MKKFKVIETNIPEYNKQEFNCETRIRQQVELPFSETTYRCVMFNGLKIHLVKDDYYIIGQLC